MTVYYQGIFLFNEADSFMIESASRWTRGRSLSSSELGSWSLSSLTMSPENQNEKQGEANRHTEDNF